MSKRADRILLDQQFDTYMSVLAIVVQTIYYLAATHNTNQALLEFMQRLHLHIEAELLDLSIKRAFPDYIPKWKREQQ